MGVIDGTIAIVIQRERIEKMTVRRIEGQSESFPCTVYLWPFYDVFCTAA